MREVEGCAHYLDGGVSFHSVYVYQINTLYTLYILPFYLSVIHTSIKLGWGGRKGRREKRIPNFEEVGNDDKYWL